jgi:hypothetical protein
MQTIENIIDIISKVPHPAISLERFIMNSKLWDFMKLILKNVSCGKHGLRFACFER